MLNEDGLHIQLVLKQVVYHELVSFVFEISISSIEELLLDSLFILMLGTSYFLILFLTVYDLLSDQFSFLIIILLTVTHFLFLVLQPSSVVISFLFEQLHQCFTTLYLLLYTLALLL